MAQFFAYDYYAQLAYIMTSRQIVWCKLAGVYVRKLVLARVSYWDDFLISYRVYMMTGSFHISLFEGTLHVDKIHV